MIFFNEQSLDSAVCYATDTRLMGVVGAMIEYKAQGHSVVELFHIDFETYGVDRFEQFIGGDSHAVKEMKLEVFGGLGGKLMRLSQEQFFHLIYEGCSVNVLLSYKVLKHDIFQTDFKPIATVHQQLMAKICVPIQNDYHGIHYYLMRLVGNDESGTAYLSDMEPIAVPVTGMLIRNQIEVIEPSHYRSTAIVATDDLYYLLTLMIRLNDSHKVIEVDQLETMEISDFEVALMVKKKEYIAIYELFDLDFEQQFLLRHKHCMVNLHENGRLVTEFKNDNSHVQNQLFLLSDDIERVYFLTDQHQLLVMTYDKEANEQFHKNEALLYHGQLQRLDILDFEEPLLYDFVDSGFDDFIDFLESL